MAGFSQGGGVGLMLAEWMIEGEPSRDVFAMDVARFGDYCTQSYTRIKVTENYQRRFSVSYPNEELPAGRPFHSTPAYGIWQQQNAVFGSAYGMEQVNYFAPQGEQPYENPTFRRSNAFATVAQECETVRHGVGIAEIHNFSKFEVKGQGAATWIDTIMAGRLPKPGSLSLNPMLSRKGKLIGDFTISNLGEDETGLAVFQMTASYVAQSFHLRWFEQHLPDEADGVRVKNISQQRVGFQIAGPKSKALLARVVRGDVSTDALPFLGVQHLQIGPCQAIVQRVSYTGDLGYEIYVPVSQQVSLYHQLSEAGKDLGLRPFGLRAMMSLRLEKSFGAWLREYRPDFMPMETGMNRFVAYNKHSDFIGKEAVLAEKARGVSRKLCTFVVDADDADVVADEPIWHDDKVVGFVTSGGYAHHVQKSVAIGFLPVELITEGRDIEIEILGDKRRATLFTKPLFDADGGRMRG